MIEISSLIRENNVLYCVTKKCVILFNNKNAIELGMSFINDFDDTHFLRSVQNSTTDCFIAANFGWIKTINNSTASICKLIVRECLIEMDCLFNFYWIQKQIFQILKSYRSFSWKNYLKSFKSVTHITVYYVQTFLLRQLNQNRRNRSKNNFDRHDSLQSFIILVVG